LQVSVHDEPARSRAKMMKRIVFCRSCAYKDISEAYVWPAGIANMSTVRSIKLRSIAARVDTFEATREWADLALAA